MAQAYDRTEAPTQRRRTEARRRGQVARSADLVSAAVLLAALVLMQTTGPKLIAAFRALLTSALSQPNANYNASDVAVIGKSLGLAMLPLLAGLMIVAAIANLLQVGFFFRFRLSEDALDIGKGMERLFSPRSRARLLIDALKIVAVAWLACSIVRQCADRIVALQQFDPASALVAGGALVFGVAIRIAVLLLTLGVLDFAYQRWQHERDLRMTRREIKDEMRQMEGDPQVKRVRRGILSSLPRFTRQEGH